MFYCEYLYNLYNLINHFAICLVYREVFSGPKSGCICQHRTPGHWKSCVLVHAIKREDYSYVIIGFGDEIISLALRLSLLKLYFPSNVYNYMYHYVFVFPFVCR